MRFSLVNRCTASAALALSLLSGAACNKRAVALPARYCDAVKTIFFYDNGLHGETDAASIKAAGARTATALDVPVQEVVADGPRRAAAAATAIRHGYEQSRDTGVDTSEELLVPGASLVNASVGGCGWHRNSVQARDYKFSGVQRFSPGLTAVTLTNHSSREAHLFLLVRVKDGVNKPASELVTEFGGPDTPPGGDVEPVDGGVFSRPGQTITGLVNLRAGRYVYFCPLPVQGGRGDADDHARRGMVGELRVR